MYMQKVENKERCYAYNYSSQNVSNKCIYFRLLHSVLYDYMQVCNPEERGELITTLSPLIVPLSNSLPGVNAASMCVWQGTNKDKKVYLLH